MHWKVAQESRRAFTLVELLVATTVIAIIMLGVHRGFSAALACWHRAETHMEAADRARDFVANLERELRSAVVLPLPEEERSFAATPERLAFFTTAGLGDRSVTPALAVTKVTYEIQKGQDTGEDRRQFTVVRKRQFFSGSFAVSEEAQSEVLSGVGGLEVLYLVGDASMDSAEWQSEWASNEPPSAVRVTLELKTPATGQAEAQVLRWRTLVPVCVRSNVE